MEVSITIDMKDLATAAMACDIVARDPRVPEEARTGYASTAARLGALEEKLLVQGVDTLAPETTS